MRNCLELVERINELSEEMSKICIQARGELNEEQSYRVDTLEYKIHQIVHCLEDYKAKGYYQEYVEALNKMQELRDKQEELPPAIYNQTMEIQEYRFRNAKGNLLDTKVVFIER